MSFRCTLHCVQISHYSSTSGGLCTFSSPYACRADGGKPYQPGSHQSAVCRPIATHLTAWHAQFPVCMLLFVGIRKVVCIGRSRYFGYTGDHKVSDCRHQVLLIFSCAPDGMRRMISASSRNLKPRIPENFGWANILSLPALITSYY